MGAAKVVGRVASPTVAAAGVALAGLAAWYAIDYFMGMDSYSDGAGIVGFFVVVIGVPLALLCAAALGLSALAMWKGGPAWLLWTTLVLSLPPLAVALATQTTNSAGLLAKAAVLVVALAALTGSSALLLAAKREAPTSQR